ncbi:MAG: TonB-dependent receptor plug domain-containing protein, partial [Hyphomicrobiaceae bacterium]
MRQWHFGCGACVGILALSGVLNPAFAQVQPPPVPEYDLPEIVVAPATIGQGKSKPKKKATAASATAPTQSQPSAPASQGQAAPKKKASAASADASSPSELVDVSDEALTIAPASQGVSTGRAQSDRIVEQITTVGEITAAQIERSGAGSLDEAIRLMPGVSVMNGGDGVPRINIRGFRTRNITLLIDGVPQGATYDGQFDPRAIPVENIARIKVTRGGSSVLYGPGGNAAVIDIITKSAGPGLHMTTETSFGAGKDKEARVTASYGSDTVRTFFSGSIYDQDNYDLSNDFDFTRLQPRDARVNSDRNDQAYYANTQWTPTDSFKWGISVNYRKGEYGKPPTIFNSFNNAGNCQNQASNGPCSPFSSGV